VDGDVTFSPWVLWASRAESEHASEIDGIFLVRSNGISVRDLCSC
jgi:hypothetical protein